MVTYIIDATEGRDVAIADIPGAFYQTDMVHGDHTVRVRIYGVLADILVKIDPSKFSDKIVLEGGHNMIYAALKNSLYDALIASLLFLWDLYGALVSWGFKLNLYGICFTTKTVNGKQ